MRALPCLITSLCLLAPGAQAQDTTAAEESAAVEEESAGGIVHGVLFYLPNRVFDLLDVVRLRARVGPGFALGARATKVADMRLGGYGAIYVGIPGPRGEARMSRPVGFESFGGATVSGLGKDGSYGAGEIGADAQIAVLGGAAGVDPLELVDLALGIFFIDIRGDDL